MADGTAHIIAASAIEGVTYAMVNGERTVIVSKAYFEGLRNKRLASCKNLRDLEAYVARCIAEAPSKPVPEQYLRWQVTHLGQLMEQAFLHGDCPRKLRGLTAFDFSDAQERLEAAAAREADARAEAAQ